ncbi:MAG: hypothetical protein ACT4OT_00735 [Acidobacteriota bacterium]
MTPNFPEIRRGVVSPMECLKEGWAAIKGQYWLIFGIVFVGVLIGNAVPVFLWGPMMCGIYLCLLRKLRGQPLDFAMLFKGFDYFAPSLVPGAVQFLPLLLLFIVYFIILFAFATIAAPTGYVSQAEANEFVTTIMLMYAGFIIAMVIVSWSIMIFLLFPYALIVDHGLSGWESVKTSARAALANFPGIFGLLLLSLLLMFAGVLACYVGAFLTWPIAFTSWAIAYRKVFGDPPPTPEALPQAVAA